MIRNVPSIAILLAVMMLACSPSRESVAVTSGPVILISIDTLRSDHLPIYGYRNVETPAIDALRADSILFTRAYAHSPLTLPSHATILTGKLPDETGVHDNAGFHLRDGIETLAEHLRKLGYRTGAAVSAYPMRGATGLSRGFDFYDDAFASTGGDRTMTDIQRSGADTIASAQKWLSENPSQKTFFFLHLYEPHTPYTPVEPFRGRYASPYDGEIATSDSLLAGFFEFLKQQGLYDNATIVLLSDHGEGLGDHGEDEHGLLLYRESIQVPLIVKLPHGTRAGDTVETPAQLIDVFPTLTNQPSLSSGAVSLLSLGSTTPARNLFAETYFPSLHMGWNDLHSVIAGDFHLIRGTRSELFSLATDPAETKDVSAEYRRERTAMNQALEPRIVPVQPTSPISEEEMRKLAALGYVGSSRSTSESRLDPRDQVNVYRESRRITTLFEKQRFDLVIAAAPSMLEKNPQLIDLWLLQIDSLSNVGRVPEALAVAKRSLANNPSAVDELAIRIADLAARSGQDADARAHAELAMRSRPAEAHAVLARIALAHRDFAGVEKESQLAIAADPRRPLPYTLLAQAAIAKNDFPSALKALDDGAKVATENHRPLRNLHATRGVILIRLGRDREAEQAFREELRLFPDDPSAWRNIVVYLVEHQRAAEARQLARQLLDRYPFPQAYAAVATSFASAGDRESAAAIEQEATRRFATRQQPVRVPR